MSNKKSTYLIISFTLFLFFCRSTMVLSQDDIVNTGSLFVSPSAIVSFEGSFTNASTAHSTNNGQVYIKKDWINDGSYTSVGTEEFTGSAAQNISGNSVTIFSDLTIDKPLNNVLLNQDAGVSGTLSLQNGPLDLNSKTITILNSSPAAIVFNSGNIISEQPDNSSKVIWNIGSTTGDHAIPFATTAGVLIPFHIDLAAGDLGNVSISTYPTTPVNTPLPSAPSAVTNLVNNSGANNSANTIDRFWQIDKTGAGGTAALTFSYTDLEIPSNGELFLAAQRYETSNDKWQPPTPMQTSDFANNRVLTPNISSFGPFTLALTSNPLPVELLYFEATLNKNDEADIAWSTTREVNNDFFTVEKSNDKIHFGTFKIIDGAGNSNSLLTYNIADERPFTGTTYYRLKQTDFNGDFTYSEIRSVKLRSKNNLVSSYPNPASENIFINYHLPVSGIADISVYNILGAEVLVEKVYVEKDVRLNIQSLPQGVYHVIIRHNEEKDVIRFVKE